VTAPFRQVRRLSRGEIVSAKEVGQVIAACVCDPSPRGYRDAALLYLLARLCFPHRLVQALNLADYHDGRISLDETGSVTLSGDAALALASWVEHRGKWPGPLFVATSRTGAVTRRRLSRSALGRVFARRCREARIRSFGLSDVLRTQTILLCGEWRDGCCQPAPGTELFAHADESLSAAPVVSHLRAVASARRKTAIRLLDLFGARMTTPADALTIPWQRLAGEELKRILDAIAEDMPRRQFNRLRRTLGGVFTRAHEDGLISPQWLSDALGVLSTAGLKKVRHHDDTVSSGPRRGGGR
jgi:hypothetical protein